MQWPILSMSRGSPHRRCGHYVIVQEPVKQSGSICVNEPHDLGTHENITSNKIQSTEMLKTVIRTSYHWISGRPEAAMYAL